MTSAARSALAFEALARNQLRSALTSLGIIIGVARRHRDDGARRPAPSVDRPQRSQASAPTSLTVSAGSSRCRRRPHGRRRHHVRSRPLMRRPSSTKCAVSRAVSPGLNTRRRSSAPAGNWQTQMQGTGAASRKMRSWTVDIGQFLRRADVDPAPRGRRSGAITRDQLFGENADPVGQIVRISNQPFRVIGVLGRKGQSPMGEDQDDAVFVPYTTVQKRILGRARTCRTSRVGRGRAKSIACCLSGDR